MTVQFTKIAPVSLTKAYRTIEVGELRRGDVIGNGHHAGVVTDGYRIGRTMTVTVVSASRGVDRACIPDHVLVDVRHQPATVAVLDRADRQHRQWRRAQA